MADPLPKSEQPKVAATAIAGNVAAFGVWLWNQQHLVEKCTHEMVNGLLTEICKVEPDKWTLIDPWDAFMVANIAWVIGPLFRRYQRWAESDDTKQAQQSELAGLLKQLQARLDKLEGKDPA